MVVGRAVVVVEVKAILSPLHRAKRMHHLPRELARLEKEIRKANSIIRVGMQKGKRFRFRPDQPNVLETASTAKGMEEKPDLHAKNE